MFITIILALLFIFYGIPLILRLPVYFVIAWDKIREFDWNKPWK